MGMVMMPKKGGAKPYLDDLSGQPPHTRVSLPIDVGRGLSKNPFMCG